MQYIHKVCTATLRSLRQLGIFMVFGYFSFVLVTWPALPNWLATHANPSLASSASADYQPDWGVLALNTDQAAYELGQLTQLSFAVLNTHGKMICDANLELEITAPDHTKTTLKTSNNTIVVNPECYQKQHTTRPDYEAKYQPLQTGSYFLSLRATTAKGTKTLQDHFSVHDQLDYQIARRAPTRIYPSQPYTVYLDVTARKNFAGRITEIIPESFKVDKLTNSPEFSVSHLLHEPQQISWETSLQKGETKTFAYTFDAPDNSPDFYELGPAKLTNRFSQTIATEARAWQIGSDATFSMQTGYYVGTGVDSRTITGLGFAPDLVILKDSSTNGSDGMLWRSSVMTAERTAKLADFEADLTTNAIQSLDSDGFTLGTNGDVNAANVTYYYMAFSGSDCTSSGTFCVGSYTGNGSAGRSLTVTGFQPNFLTIKRSGASGAVFKTSSMAGNTTQFYENRVQDTTADFINSLDATGFTVGVADEVNFNGGTMWFFAFKNASNAFAVGSFTGNGTSQSINTVGFSPIGMFIKNATNATGAEVGMNIKESYGAYTLPAIDAAAITTAITSLDASGFSVGAATQANENTATIYWIAFGGGTANTASGRYKMTTGSYSGNGTSQSVTSLGFRPDVVIIKHVDQVTDQFAVFTTSLHTPAHCAYFASATANITSLCITINSDGFSVGSNATVNTSGDTYYWEAFGNAWNPNTRTGAADFMVGAYNGTAVDSRNITGLPFQPNIVVIKSSAANLAVWRSSATAGDLTSFFSAAAEAADHIQTLNSDGFTLGKNSRVNSSTTTVTNYYFAFKTGPDTKTGYYSGNNGTQSITSPNIEPNLVWIKRTTAVAGVFKPSALAGDSTQYFINSPSATGRITSLDTVGFSVGNNTETSTSGTNNYLYAAWKIPTTYTQNDFEWYVTGNTVTLTDIWPPSAGGADFAENTAITQMPASNAPPAPGDKLRIQMNLTTAGSRMGSSQQDFKLQYSAASDCTAASSWTDVGAKASGSIWRLFDEASIGDSTAQVNQISTSNASSEGYYSEINPSGTNPNAVPNGNNTEWDWPVQNNGAADSTTYCFRMALSDSTALTTYNADSYPKLTTAPALSSLMRHGNFFLNQAEQGMFWNN